MPKKVNDSKSSGSSKRKMLPPGAARRESGVPQLDHLFSQLFSSVLGRGPESEGEDSPPNPLAAWESMMRQNPRMSQSESHSDDETDSEDDGDHSDHDDCDHEEGQVEHFDPRWESINKLIESHVNLTRAVSDLTRRA